YMHKVSDTQPWHRQFWPWFLIALPAVVVIACFYTVYLALNNPLSIVKEDYYKEGLAINQNQQRYIKAAELGLAARCLLERQYLRCELTTDTNKRDATPLQIQFMHPVNSEKDISTSLLPVDYAVFRSEPLTESVQ